MTHYKIENNADRIDFAHMLYGDMFIAYSGAIYIKIQEVNVNKCNELKPKNALCLDDGNLVFIQDDYVASRVKEVIIKPAVKS